MSNTKDKREHKDRTGEAKGQQYDSNPQKNAGRVDESKDKQYDSNLQRDAGDMKTSGKGDQIPGMRNAQKSAGRSDERVEDDSARRTK